MVYRNLSVKLINIIASNYLEKTIIAQLHNRITFFKMYQRLIEGLALFQINKILLFN